MKLKGMLLTTALTAMLGVGVFAGVSGNRNEPVEKAEAATTFTKGQNLYLVPGVWSADNAAYIAHFYGNNKTEKDLWLTYDSTGGDWYNATYHVIVPDEFDKVIFCRMNPNASSGSWTLNGHEVWNQTDGISAGQWDKCSITGWNQNNHSQSNQTASAFDTWQVSTWSPDTTTLLNNIQNNDKGTQLYNTTVSLTAGSRFKVVNKTKNWYIGSNGFEDGGACDGKHLKKGDGEADVSILQTGTYEVYVKLNTKTVWVQISSNEEASIYAREFVSSVTCTDNSVTFNINVWNKVGDETTSMEYKFESLSEGARSLLTNSTVNKDGTDIQKCAARYDRILRKYGYGDGNNKYHDFMGRTPAPISGSAFVNNMPTDNGSTTTVATVMASVIAISTAAGFVFLKKKKITK